MKDQILQLLIEKIESPSHLKYGGFGELTANSLKFKTKFVFYLIDGTGFLICHEIEKPGMFEIAVKISPESGFIGQPCSPGYALMLINVAGQNLQSWPC